MENFTSEFARPRIESSSKVQRRDPFDPSACPHVNCGYVPKQNTESIRAKHRLNARAHAATCANTNCSTCLNLWGCLANEQAVKEFALKYGVQISDLSVQNGASLRNSSASSSATPRTTPRLSRRNSSPLNGFEADDAESLSFASLNSSAALRRRLSNSSDFEKNEKKSIGRKRALELKQSQDHAEIVKGLKVMIKKMPHNSALRPQVVASIVENTALKKAKISSILDVSPATVSRALASEDQSAVLMNRKRNAPKAPRKTSDAIAFAVQCWYDLSRRTQKRDDNGEQLDLYLYDMNQDEMFDAYRVLIIERAMMNDVDLSSVTFTSDKTDDERDIFFQNECKKGNAVKRSKFISLRPKNVKKGEIRECSCPICNEGFSNLGLLNVKREELHENCKIKNCSDAKSCKMIKQNEEVKKLEKIDVSFQLHRERVREQRQYFIKLRDGGLKNNEALLLFDFSPYNNAYRHRRSLAEGMTGVQCLHIVLFVGNGSDKSDVRYFDYFSEDSNDYYFFRHAMLDFCDRDDVKSLEIKHYFSDGGPKHFKIRRSIGFALIELPLLFSWPQRPQWHFFEAHHGKSACDSRAAVVKYFLKRLALRGVDSVGAVGITKNINFSKEQKLTHRNATALGFFDKSNDYDWKEFQSIRKWHLLQWTGREKIVNAIGNNKRGRAFILRCLETSTTNDDIVELLAIPKYKIESLAAKENRRKETISKKEKNQRKRESMKEAKDKAAKDFLGIAEENETIVNTNIKEYKAGKLVAVLYDDKWYVGKIKKMGSDFIGRRRMAEGEPKVEVYIKKDVRYVYRPFRARWRHTEANVDRITKK